MLHCRSFADKYIDQEQYWAFGACCWALWAHEGGIGDGTWHGPWDAHIHHSKSRQYVLSSSTLVSAFQLT